MIPPGGNIVVLLDCWDPAPLAREHPANFAQCQQLTQNILTRIHTIPDLAAVILATYTSKNEIKNSALKDTNPYYKNAWQMFYFEQPVDYIRRHFVDALDRIAITDVGLEHDTDPLLLNQIWPCMQIAMHDSWQMEYYIRHVVPHVRNLFYFGRSWNYCLHQRPIGINAMLAIKQWQHLPGLRLFTYSDCILALENHHVMVRHDLHNDHTCQHINDDLFEIVGSC
jgi:hypothetical protein